MVLIVGFGAESLIAGMIAVLFAIIGNRYDVGNIIGMNGFRGIVSGISVCTYRLTDAGGNAPENLADGDF